MKKLLTTLALAGSLMAGTLVACAHGVDHDPAKHMEKRLEKMKSSLALTDAQAAQIKTIYTQNQAKFEADRNAVKAAAKGSDAKKAAFQQMRADRQAVQAQVKAILTPDQQAKWQAFQDKHEKRGHDKKDGDKDNDAQPKN